MKSIDERLAESNPVAQGYVPTNYDQMLTSAMRQPRVVDSAWKAFRLRMASSVAAASALTVLGVSALNGAGAALPVLGFSATAPLGPSAAAAKDFSGSIGGIMIPVVPNYSFIGGDNFSNVAGSAPVYALHASTDLVASLGAVVTSLGVTLGTTVDTSNSSTYYGVSGTGYSGSVFNNGGSDYWNIYATPNGATGASGTTGAVGTAVPSTTSPATATGATGVTGATGATGVTGATGPVAATGSLAAQALGFVQAIGDYSAGSATQTMGGGVTSITVPLLINGYPSDMSDSFNFNSDGTLQSASGSTFTLSTVATYPLISESAGVDQITAQESLFRHFIAYSKVAPTASPATTPNALSSSVSVKTSSASNGPSGSTGVTGTTGATGVTGDNGVTGSSGATGATTTTTLAAPTVVNLTTVTLAYSSYEMKGGVWMELPVYDYTGTVVKGGYQVGFNVVPLPSQYLDFAPTVLPLGAR